MSFGMQNLFSFFCDHISMQKWCNGSRLYLKVVLSYKRFISVCNKSETHLYNISNDLFKCRCHFHLLYIPIQHDMTVYDRDVLKTELIYSSFEDQRHSLFDCHNKDAEYYRQVKDCNTSQMGHRSYCKHVI